MQRLYQQRLYQTREQRLYQTRGRMIIDGKYKNKYRIASARLQAWNYGWKGAYFITICTQNKEHYFGKIIDEGMRLSHIGILADVFWYEIKNHAKNIELGEFVVMPNHLHGILIINSVVETLHATSLYIMKHNRNYHPKTNPCRIFHQNPVRFQRLFVPINRRLPNTPTD